MNTEVIDKLNKVLDVLKQKFVGKDDIVDLMGICLAGRENLFLLGPPGTAKSALVRELARLIDGKTFEYLLTRFTEPNELFGPFDIRKLREGELITNTEGMLPEANLIFLDELLNANSAILNSLLMILNEKIFRRGKENKDLPVLMIVGASNHLPEEASLQALFDRFLLRVRCDYVDPSMLNQVLDAGWKLEQPTSSQHQTIASGDLFILQKMITQINLDDIRKEYIELIQKLRNAGISVSDRRAVKLQRLIAGSALLCKRDTAILSDFWVLRYIWDTEEQIEVLAEIVNQVIQKDSASEKQHPRAVEKGAPDADELMKELQKLSEKWDQEQTQASERAIIKDRLRHLNARSEWLSNETQRTFVKHSMDEFWKKILRTS